MFAAARKVVPSAQTKAGIIYSFSRTSESEINKWIKSTGRNICQAQDKQEKHQDTPCNVDPHRNRLVQYPVLPGLHAFEIGKGTEESTNNQKEPEFLSENKSRAIMPE